MKKQNRTLIVVFGFILALVVFFLIQTGNLKNNEIPTIDVKADAENAAPATQESLGEPLKDESKSAVNAEEQKIFGAIGSDLLNCFDLKAGSLPESLPIQIESLVTAVQADFGPSTSHQDRWMNWHLRNRENSERRVRLEVNEGENGAITRELKYFAVDKEGLPVPLELAPEKKNNPSDENLDQMLKEGEVFFKEKSAYVAFAGGEHIEYVEKNGELSEFEFQKGDRFFRCQNLKTRDACQCVK